MKKILSCLLLAFSLSIAANDFESATITNAQGTMKMNVINFGARIQSLEYKGQDVVLGFDTLSHYRDKKQNFGAVVGRYIGRIVGGKFTLDDTEYTLQGGDKGRVSDELPLPGPVGPEAVGRRRAAQSVPVRRAEHQRRTS